MGAGIVIGLDQYLVALGDFRTLAEGLILAGIAVFAPQGVWPLLRNAFERFLAPESSPARSDQPSPAGAAGPPDDRAQEDER